jgi:hypothetical protein
LYFWLLANAAFGGIITAVNTGSNVTVINRDFTFLDGFALFVASLVTFKFVFALVYTLKWNFRRWTNPYYRNPPFNLNEEFKKMRRDRNGAYSTDEDEEDEDAVFGKNETVGEGGKVFDKKTDGSFSVRENTEIDDSDNDDMEFDDAHDEEHEDRILMSQRRSTIKNS